MTYALAALVCSGSLPAAARTVQAGMTERDLRAYQHLENAQGQLDEWCARLAGRLRRGEAIPADHPVLDGRARFQIEKIRQSYAPFADSTELAGSMLALAAAHEARVEALAEMTERGFSNRRYRRLDHRVTHYLQRIRDWRERS